MTRLLGILLFIAGIYFLGKNIIFATTYFPYYYRSLPSIGSVLSIISGIIALVFFRRATGNLGWILLGIGIVLVFLSGGVILRPTSLWSFFVSFAALAVGYKLVSEGRINNF
jgi:hypothetical protein